VQTIEVTEDFIAIHHHNPPVKVYFSDIPGNGWPEGRREVLKNTLQNLLDKRINRAQWAQDYPDDPYVLADPARPRAFWDGGDIVIRTKIVDEVFQKPDGTIAIRLRQPAQ
jgi:hypothetical protein